MIKAFGASQGEEAKAFWRDLTDNRGKACVLLEEPEQELLRLGKEYFGNTHFAEKVGDTLQDMPDAEQTQFLDWLKQSLVGKLWG